MLLLGIGFATPLVAAEIAELRNGFAIPHRSREIHEGSVRLFLDEAKKSFVDLPVDEIQRYTSQPDPAPSAPGETSSANTAMEPANAIKSTDQIVHEASEKQGVDSDFINSVIRQESAGNSHAVSPAGARGLMQLMPGTAQGLGVKDSFSPEENVHGGARYLRELLERYNGDAVKALAAYNAGPGAVDRYRGVPPYRETRLYVQRIVRDYNRKKQRAESAEHLNTERGSSAHRPGPEPRRAPQVSDRQERAAVAPQ
jgi:soluble lytic murein transglycosylase-like protein